MPGWTRTRFKLPRCKRCAILHRMFRLVGILLTILAALLVAKLTGAGTEGPGDLKIILPSLLLILVPVIAFGTFVPRCFHTRSFRIAKSHPTIVRAREQGWRIRVPFV
jgi:hypothetical protein